VLIIHFAATVASKFARFKNAWAKLDHAVIAAAVCQWRRRLLACVKAAVIMSNTAFNSDIAFMR